MMLRKTCLMFLLLAGLCTATATRSATEMLPAKGLQADVDVLEQAYTQLHPGLHRYNTPAQMAGHFADLRKALDHDQPLASAYLAFSQFAATVRCGHTYANFYNQPKDIAQAILQSPTRVPFHFRWLDGRMVVTRNLSPDASLVPGTEILSIDGVPVAEILARMMSIARADGGNDAKRRATLEVQGNDRYEAFDVYLPLFFPGIGSQQSLQVRSPGETAVRTLSVPALTHAQRLAARPAAAADASSDDAPAFTVSYRDDGVAVLDMPGWALYDSRWDWRAFLTGMFEDLQRRKVTALVIDLRRNEGGLDVGDEILAYLTAQPLALPAYERKVRYRKTPLALRPYLDTWDPSFHDWGTQVTPVADGFYRLVREGQGLQGDVIAPKSPRFAGRVYVLVGAVNSSATFEFAGAIQRAGLGTLVGQTTGGNRRGINGGSFFFLRLPNSKIELDLPLVAQFPVEPQPDAGLEPDIPVAVTVADIAAGRDAELAAALADLARR